MNRRRIITIAATLTATAALTLTVAGSAAAATANVLPAYFSATPYPATIATGWSASPTAHQGITTYHIQLALANTGTIEQDNRITGTSYRFGGLAPSTRYQWRLAVGMDPWHLASPWSPWRTVYTTGAPPPPVVCIPPTPAPDGVPCTQIGQPITSLNGSQILATFDKTQTFFDGCGPANPCTQGTFGTDDGGNALLTTTGANRNNAQLSSATLGGQGLLYTHGIFEAQLNLPAAPNGQIANWPAFWLSGVNWPIGGEFDIAEGLGGHQFTDYHWNTGGGTVGTRQWEQSAIAPGWHVFDAVWGPGYVAVYVDGTQVASYTSSNVESDAPLMVIFDMASGSAGLSTGQPSTLMVAYLRVWGFK